MADERAAKLKNEQRKPKRPSKTRKALESMLAAIKNNYINGIHYGWISFCITFLWTIIFSTQTELGLNFLMIVCFTILMAIIAGVSYERGVFRVAGVVFPIYIALCLLFTTTYVFNPSKEYAAVYAKNGEPGVVSYATEPWVVPYDPYVWKHALFYKTDFISEAKKYVEFDKKDVLVTLSMKFRLDADLAIKNFTTLDAHTRDRDINAATEVMRQIIATSVKELLESENFTYHIESLTKTLVHLAADRQHQIKLEIFSGALQILIQQRVRTDQAIILLYTPLFESAKISVTNAIYSRPSG